MERQSRDREEVWHAQFRKRNDETVKCRLMVSNVRPGGTVICDPDEYMTNTLSPQLFLAHAFFFVLTFASEQLERYDSPADIDRS
jgi:hypothetical protein